MNWGIVGAGDIVRKRIIDAIRSTDGAKLLGITRRDAATLDAFADEFAIPRRYRDLSAMLADPEIDAVYIATPVVVHAKQTIAAAKAGKHVLCEKPIAFDTVEADHMIAACKAAGITLGVAYYRRFYPVIHRISELIATGVIGSVSQARIDAFETFDPPPGHPRFWILEPEKSGGGPMIDFGCHRIDILMALFPPQGDHPELASIHVTSTLDRKVEDNAVAVLRLGGDVLATVAVSHSIGVPQDTVTIWGSSGMIHCPGLNAGNLELTQITPDGARQTTREEHPPHRNLHQPLIADFESAVADRRAPTIDGEQGRRVTTILDRIYRKNV